MVDSKNVAVEEALKKANDELIKTYNSGDLDGAERIARSLLKAGQESMVVYNLLGIVQHTRGQLEEAVSFFEKAIELQPDYGDSYSNIAHSLGELGRLEEALGHCNKAIELKPELAGAYNNRGFILRKLGRSRDAVLSYDRAIELAPGFVDAYSNRGNSLVDLGDLEEALRNYEKAIELKPDFPIFYLAIGEIQRDLGLTDLALNSFEKAIVLDPKTKMASFQKARILRSRKKFVEAKAVLEKAMEWGTDYLLYNEFGITMSEMQRYYEADENYLKAIELKPDFALAYINRADVLTKLGKLDEATECCLLGLQLDPQLSGGYYNLGVIKRDLGDLEEALRNYEKAIELKPDFPIAYSNLLFTISQIRIRSDEENIKRAREFGEVVGRTARTFTSFNCPKEADRLRVGFVSGDLRNHPVGYWTEGFLAEIDNSKIELIAYPTLPNEDELTRRLRSFFSKWQPVYGQDDEAVAKMIHDDHIHVLFDMSGHTQYNRLPVFAWKPAPVQVSWLGYFATTGLNEMDYILGDPYVTPKSEEGHFVENIWPMPESYVCFTPPDVDIEVNELPAISSESITFGCFNNLIKINDEVVSVWSRILKALPGSRMFLKTKTLNSEEECRKIKERFLNHGVESGRLILEGESPRSGLLAAYQRVDIALDPFPYPGGTTSAESVWMGVPVVTLRGKNFLSHVGESIITNAGLPDWVAIDEEDYVRKAIDFASDLDALSSLRSGLRAKLLTSPLYDTKRFARYFETAVRDMWKKWLEKQNG